MKNLGIAAVVVGLASLVIGMIARLNMTSIPIAKPGLVPMSFLHLANACFLLAISLLLLELVNKK